MDQGAGAMHNALERQERATPMGEAAFGTRDNGVMGARIEK